MWGLYCVFEDTGLLNILTLSESTEGPCLRDSLATTHSGLDKSVFLIYKVALYLGWASLPVYEDQDQRIWP